MAEIDALFLGLEPKLAQAAGNSILFHAKGGNGPAVDHVRTCQLHHDNLVDRNNDRCVGGQKEFILAIARFDQLCLDLGAHAVFTTGGRCADHVAVKAEIMVGIFIAPVPLIAGHLDMNFAIGNFLLLEQNGKRKRPDEHQDDNRNDRPGDFDRGIVRECRRGCIYAPVIAHGHNGKKHGHEKHDGDDDHVDHPVKPLQIAGQFGRGGLESQLAIYGLADDLKTVLRHGRKSGKGGHNGHKA